MAGALLDEGEVAAHQMGDAVLGVANLSALSDKGLDALHGLSLEIRAGETLGIAGVAGNGQRELAEVITGLRPATGGTVSLKAQDVTGHSPRAIARIGIAHVPEDRLGTGLVGRARPLQQRDPAHLPAGADVARTRADEARHRSPSPTA